uniref:HECT domain-containing protein n=1 Tax=Bicosoecida sp. CB-2014 TaxID=1486930 RepID=A0A7S1CA38_9STRA
MARLPTAEARLKRSLLGQLYAEVRGWPASAFRRSYVGKGHGGQERAFKVKFLGEGVNDYGGPYRAVFEQLADELQWDRFGDAAVTQAPAAAATAQAEAEIAKAAGGAGAGAVAAPDSSGEDDRGSPAPGATPGATTTAAVPKPADGALALLPVLVPSPARQGGVDGESADRFVLNPSRDMATPAALDLFSFVGVMWGVAVRHRLTVPLALPSVVWRPLSGEPVTPEDLFAINPGLRALLGTVRPPSASALAAVDATFTAQLSDGSSVELVPGGAGIRVTPANWRAWRRLAIWRHLSEAEVMLRALREGVRAVLPAELMPLFSPRELAALFCGEEDVNVDELRRATRFGDGYSATSPQVLWLWEVLSEATPQDRSAFLRFACARSRLQSTAGGGKALQIELPTGRARDNPDAWLPSSQTCFSQLALPAYSSKAVLRAKLWHAAWEALTMDADVRLHSAEGWADL